MKRLTTTLAVALAALGLMNVAHSGVSVQEAEQLKSKLTPMGAEREGNKDGSIPAWTGGMMDVPAGLKATAGDRRLDPFAEDKPLYTITVENMAQYADKLNDGVKAMLERYPKTFKLDVYPTRRTAAAPQWVYDNTFKNATQATLANDGLTVDGARGGVPFPIPKNGAEVIWNQRLAWRGESTDQRYKIWVVTADGKQVLAGQTITAEQYPYYSRDGKSDPRVYQWFRQITEAPGFRSGEGLLTYQLLDFKDGDGPTWQYLPGQRRVRRAPNVGFDTPDFVASGANFFDEAFGGIGSLERFDWKLLGKKEMYIPYNTNKLFMVPDAEAMGPNHLKTENLRWELHRVWVVEATVKAGKRHAVSRRMFYTDEDTWQTALLDGWDGQGKLWRTTMALPFVAPDIPAVITSCRDAFYNLQTNAWVYRCSEGDSNVQYKVVPSRNEEYFSPDALSSGSSR